MTGGQSVRKEPTCSWEYVANIACAACEAASSELSICMSASLATLCTCRAGPNRLPAPAPSCSDRIVRRRDLHMHA